MQVCIAAIEVLSESLKWFLHKAQLTCLRKKTLISQIYRALFFPLLPFCFDQMQNETSRILILTKIWPLKKNTLFLQLLFQKHLDISIFLIITIKSLNSWGYEKKQEYAYSLCMQSTPKEDEVADPFTCEHGCIAATSNEPNSWIGHSKVVLKNRQFHWDLCLNMVENRGLVRWGEHNGIALVHPCSSVACGIWILNSDAKLSFHGHLFLSVQSDALWRNQLSLRGVLKESSSIE